MRATRSLSGPSPSRFFPAFTGDPELLRRFEQEGRATAALNHPGVMALYDVGVHEGAPYLVTELLEGQTLRERLDGERLSVRQAVDFARQIADALAAAHDQGVVHRDLKPENVFVTSQDRIKILDFGLAKLAAPDSTDYTLINVTGTLPNTVLGTPAYMPPEQARGQKVDHRADIFSFGCIFYEMLQGHRAFSGQTMADVISAILKEAPAALTSSVDRPLPPVLDGIVQRCLSKEPSGRFQSASDLAFALRGISEAGSVGSANVYERTPPPAVPVRTNRWRLPAVVAGAAAAGALIALLATRMGTGPAPARPLEFLVPPPGPDDTFASMPLPGLLPTSPQVGLSPNGRQLAFVSSDAAGVLRLWIRSLDDSRPKAVDGLDGVTGWPFWSPDNRFVVISAKRGLVKIDAARGTIERLCALPDDTPAVPFVTGSWSEDGTILFFCGRAARTLSGPGLGGSCRGRDDAGSEPRRSLSQLAAMARRRPLPVLREDR